MMNLANNPKIEELQELLAKCDETLGHHFLWVRNDGEVFIRPLYTEMPSLDKYLEGQGMKFRTASFGVDCVGQKASQSTYWTARLFGGICKLWAGDATDIQEDW